jgi:hypothetical protein
MEYMRKVTRSNIQYFLKAGKVFSNYVIKSLGLSNSFTQEELQEKIRQDLVKMNFLIEYHESLSGKDGREIPSFINLNGYDRKAGGIIMLNKKFPLSSLRQALFREYAIIKDEKLPIHTTNRNAFNSMSFFDSFYMEYIEYLADMNAYSLMMPPDIIKEQLLDRKYDINEMLNIYGNVEKDSIFQWIFINNHLPCHYMYIILEKDSGNNILQRIVYDNCFYDHQSDPVTFSVDAVLACPESVASIALREKKIINKLSVIDNMNKTPYFCYAYYESDVSKEIIHYMLPYLKGEHYDRLLVIGWTKQYYDMIVNYGNLV